MKNLIIGCAALLIPALAFGFVRSTGGGKVLFWATPNVPVTLNPNGPSVPASGCTDVSAVVSASLAAWSQPCSSFSFQFVGVDANALEIGYREGGTNRNVIVFRSGICSAVVPAVDACRIGDPNDPDDDGPDTPDCIEKHNCFAETGARVIALTTTSFVCTRDSTGRCVGRNDGRILDADMELNDWDGLDQGYKFTCTNGPPCTGGTPNGTCVGTDLASIVTHEAGHMLGLDHPPDKPTATMYATYTPGSVALRELDVDDVNGVCAVYPAPGGDGGGSGGCSTAMGGVLSMLGVALALARRRALTTR